MLGNQLRGAIGLLVAGLFLGLPHARAQSISANPSTASVPPGQSHAAGSSRFQPDRFAGRAGKYYALVWGVDSLSVKAVESGELIRFSYEVLDAAKAGPLNDKRLEPKWD